MFDINKQVCIFVSNKYAMIRKEDLRAIIREQNQNLSQDERTIPRAFPENPDLNSRQAVVITGVRRCGKSTVLKQLMKQKNSLYFLSFEDLRLTDFEPQDFMKVEEVFHEEFKESKLFFFDEIQNIPGWEVFIRQLLDKRKQVIITGSNARLLSKELGTHLTGRHTDHELFPFSYTEYLQYSEMRNTKKAFSKYLIQGGLPEYLQNNRKEYLQNLLTDILIRDIAVRYGIRNIKVLKEMAVFLLSNLGKEFSFQSLRKVFGLGAVSTVIEYISMYEECYLLFSIPRFDFSLKKQSYHPKKVYAVDNGLAIANSLSFSSDTGRMLENLVFNALRRKYKEIFYFRKNKECDFIIRQPDSAIRAIQVCSQLTSDNKIREIEGLFEAMEFFNLRQGYLLTMDEEDELRRDDREILIRPVRKWLESSFN